jgi:hypothetical protein
MAILAPSLVAWVADCLTSMILPTSTKPNVKATIKGATMANSIADVPALDVAVLFFATLSFP